LDFTEVIARVDEDTKILETLKARQIDLRTVSKIENMMVRDLLIVTYTSYQRNVVNAVLNKVKHHASNYQAIVNLVQRKIERTNIGIETLSNLLGLMMPLYKSNFALALADKEGAASYTNIIEGRINVAHEQGNNLQIGSISEIREAHGHAKRLLDSFESCMW